jgi:hypothetical protein
MIDINSMKHLSFCKAIIFYINAKLINNFLSWQFFFC